MQLGDGVQDASEGVSHFSSSPPPFQFAAILGIRAVTTES